MIHLPRARIREIDRRAIEEFGVPGIVLMENAGRGAAEILTQLNSDREPVLILCGKGNNGGDGFVIARHLDNAGIPVTAHLIGSAGLPPDAETNFQIAKRSTLVGDEPIGDRIAAFQGWIVDALFGTGLTGPLRSPYDGLVNAINSSKATVFAVDIPSGLDCDTGKPLGATVRANHTVTFVAPKMGFAAPEAREWVGMVHVVGIGAPRPLLEEYGVAPLESYSSGR